MRPLELIDDKSKKTMYSCLLAETWNELTGKQLSNFCTWFYINRGKLFDYDPEEGKSILKDHKLFEQIKHMLLMSLMGMKLSKYERLSDEVKFRLLNESGILDFLWTENTRTKAPFRRVNVGSLTNTKWYYAPGEMLKGCTFEEFILVDKYYMAYLDSAKEDFLNSFCTILYRPAQKNLNPNDPQWNGDWREIFNATLASDRVAQWRRVPIGDRMAILRYYDGCRRRLKKLCPYLFQEAEEKKVSEPGDWTDILHSIAGGKFGTLADTKNAPYMEVLQDMDKSIRDYENRKSNS